MYVFDNSGSYRRLINLQIRKIEEPVNNGALRHSATATMQMTGQVCTTDLHSRTFTMIVWPTLRMATSYAHLHVQATMGSNVLWPLPPQPLPVRNSIVECSGMLRSMRDDVLHLSVDDVNYIHDGITHRIILT